MNRFLKEPLLHFLLLGAGIFAAYGVVSKRGGKEPGKILITAGQVENLATTFSKAWQRPPTAGELANLVRERVREEMLCREAVALGLDQGDTVIRRRLRQKMEFVSDDIAAQSEPTDSELSSYLLAHSEKFRTEPRFTFRQIYLNPEKRGKKLQQDAAQILARLQQSGNEDDIATLGDSFLLEQDFTAAPAGEIVKQFGGGFAEKLGALQNGQWQGPIESEYGLHLVKIDERADGHSPALAEVRDAVRREWSNARRHEANENFYQDLLGRYVVTIEQPRPTEHVNVASTK